MGSQRLVPRPMIGLEQELSLGRLPSPHQGIDVRGQQVPRSRGRCDQAGVPENGPWPFRQH